MSDEQTRHDEADLEVNPESTSEPGDQPNPQHSAAPPVEAPTPNDLARDETPQPHLADDEPSPASSCAEDDTAPQDAAAPTECDGSCAEEDSAIEKPTKVLRVAGMVKRLMDELRDIPLNDGARWRLTEIHKRAYRELTDGLASELVEELDLLIMPLADDAPPLPETELRIVLAQLVGWLEGLFNGFQVAMVAQQVAAAAQQAMGGGKGLPPGVMIAMGGDGIPGGIPGRRADGDQSTDAPGQYL
ncbi:MAG: DUF2587 domain-containing protein [Promicromonosporaceae bacterium]|nr:DUF2587 domain-containing protein [Promicromonosporaceae bacterium]